MSPTSLTSSQNFGGNWTSEKLKRVEKYLRAYTTIMSKQPYTSVYIDAFAGTGYRNLPSDENPNELLLPELADQEPQAFLDGSARIALNIHPPFSKYVFIEKSENRAAELKKLAEEYKFNRDVIVRNEDANNYLQNICANYTWTKFRAVVFLDPFGMQVSWNTIEAISKTKAIDLWILFPLGVAINRLLKKDGNISETWKSKLDHIFGTKDWYDKFYQVKTVENLFGEESCIEKVGNFEIISQYFVDRLKAIFPGVADNPLPLCNSRNNPLYLLCFASANPTGSKTAIKIAQDILKG